MTHRHRPEDEASPQQRDMPDRLRAIARWLQHAEDELLYAPDTAEEAAAPALEPGTFCAGERAASGSLPSCASRWTPGIP